MTMIGIAVSPCVARAPQRWTPLKTAPLIWLRSRKVTLVGGAVDVALDQSGNGRDVTIGGGAVRPGYDNSGPYPWITFDGTQWLRRAGALGSGSAYTWALVLQSAGLVGAQCPAYHGNDFNTGYGVTTIGAATRRVYHGGDDSIVAGPTEARETWIVSHPGALAAPTWRVNGVALAPGAQLAAAAARRSVSRLARPTRGPIPSSARSRSVCSGTACSRPTRSRSSKPSSQRSAHDPLHHHRIRAAARAAAQARSVWGERTR